MKRAAQALLVGGLLSGAALFAQAGPDGSTASSRSSSAAAAPAHKSPAASGKKSATGKTSSKRDPRTVGLGRSCSKRSDCSSKAHVCLRQQDQRGKMLARGFCALPCARIEQGLTPTRPGFPARDPRTTGRILKKPPPPRCPVPFKCRSKGADIPIDLCVRE